MFESTVRKPELTISEANDSITAMMTHSFSMFSLQNLL